MNANGRENFEKIHFDRPTKIRHRRVHYVIKKLIFNKKRLLIVLHKVKFLKCNTLQDTLGVRGVDSEVSYI